MTLEVNMNMTIVPHTKPHRYGVRKCATVNVSHHKICYCVQRDSAHAML